MQVIAAVSSYGSKFEGMGAFLPLPHQLSGSLDHHQACATTPIEPIAELTLPVLADRSYDPKEVLL
jgi:hypothetical protein